jgi:hypothetical protein
MINVTISRPERSFDMLDPIDSDAMILRVDWSAV